MKQIARRVWKLVPWILRHKWAVFAEAHLPVSARQHRNICDAMQATQHRLKQKIHVMEGARPSKSVTVVVANDGEKVKECLVFSDSDEAMSYFRVCKEIYGGASVALCGRAIDDVPRNLAESGLARLERLAK